MEQEEETEDQTVTDGQVAEVRTTYGVPQYNTQYTAGATTVQINTVYPTNERTITSTVIPQEKDRTFKKKLIITIILSVVHSVVGAGMVALWAVDSDLWHLAVVGFIALFNGIFTICIWKFSGVVKVTKLDASAGISTFTAIMAAAGLVIHIVYYRDNYAILSILLLVATIGLSALCGACSSTTAFRFRAIVREDIERQTQETIDQAIQDRAVPPAAAPQPMIYPSPELYGWYLNQGAVIPPPYAENQPTAPLESPPPYAGKEEYGQQYNPMYTSAYMPALPGADPIQTGQTHPGNSGLNSDVIGMGYPSQPATSQPQ